MRERKREKRERYERDMREKEKEIRKTDRETRERERPEIGAGSMSLPPRSPPQPCQSQA